MKMTMEEKVEKLMEDVYVGKGKENPSITSRLLLLEDAIERFGKNSSRLVWIGITALVMMAVDILAHNPWK